jgi:protein-L-isoaspartate(D-aspartate) O-methyltransferase
MSDHCLDAAFESVARADFLPPDQVSFAHQDRALRLDHGQTNSQPSTVHTMLSLLDVRPGHRVLDVGSGSAWTTALLGVLVGAEGRVSGVELVPELVTWGRQNLAAYSMPWATITAADPAVLGLPDLAPFDRILVSAAARSLPQPLVEQLCPGGVMVAPVAHRMAVVRRSGAQADVVLHGHYMFVPLVTP